MSYSEFTLDEVIRKFNVTVREQRLFEHVECIEPSAWLREALELGRSVARQSEKARSEFIVAPVLAACMQQMPLSVYIYSGMSLDVDPEQGLNGECDFILARTAPTPVLQAPFLIVVEAKKQDIEEGLGQCAAQMIAARMFNESHHQMVPAIFGCVTTGETWQFLKLEDSLLLTDADRYFIAQLELVLGILFRILRGRDTFREASDAA